MSNHDVDCLQRPLTRRSGCPSPRRQLAASVAAAEHGTVSQALPLLCGKNGSAICGIDRQASLSTLSVNRSSGACLALLHHQTRWAPSVRTGDFDPDWSDSEQHSAETDAFVATFAELRGLIGNRYDSRLGERRRRCSPLTVEQEAGHSAPASARPAISAAASAHGEATADFQEALLLKAREHPWAEQSEAHFAKTGEMDVQQFTTAVNALRRLLADIGLERVARDVPSLDEWMRKRESAT